MNLQLRNVTLPLADFVLELDTVFTSQVTGVFGSSGSGKTSLLDLVAGLRRPRTGRLQLGDRVLTDVSCRLPASGLPDNAGLRQAEPSVRFW